MDRVFRRGHRLGACLGNFGSAGSERGVGERKSGLVDLSVRVQRHPGKRDVNCGSDERMKSVLLFMIRKKKKKNVPEGIA